MDWDGSGWGDPAFDIAGLIAHAAYVDVPLSRWEWVVDTYCRLAGDDGMAVRIGVYRRALLLFWAIRLARFLYEVPRGLDPRLVERPEGWEVDIRRKYDRYLALADSSV